MILHTVNKSPFTNSSLKECLKFCSNKSSVLLIEDGVYGGQTNTEYTRLIDQHKHINFYALEADVLARGLNQKLHPSVTLVNDKKFVELCTTHMTVQSWY